jgi:hypothetical protein
MVDSFYSCFHAPKKVPTLFITHFIVAFLPQKIRPFKVVFKTTRTEIMTKKQF